MDALSDATPVNLSEGREDSVPGPMDSTPMELGDAASDMEAVEAAPRKPSTVSDILVDSSQYYDESEIVAEGIYRFDILDWSAMRHGEERQYSPDFEIAGMKWRLLLFPRGNRQNEFLSVFIESLDAKKPAEELGERWHACVHFALAAANSQDPSTFVNSMAHHRFTVKESDWGFNQLIRFPDLVTSRDGRPPILEDNKFTLVAFVRVVKDATGVLWLTDLSDYDSKKETGYVGLKNQGATCYMNSLLQSLYFTSEVRKAVYHIPTENDTPTNSIPLALQRVFYNLQFSSTPPDTRELTKSFGWTTLDAFMQHDVQEFNRVLQDNLETKMKGTKAEGTIKRIFGGKSKSYVKCVNVDYESSRVEDFNDIQLVVRGCPTLRESFLKYVAVEMMDGDNKYAAEGHGFQDAKKGVSFVSFPPVLHLQLIRFDYDVQKDAMAKINDRFEFPPQIDLAEFLDESADKTEDWNYVCVGVLVHAGDTQGGHYYAMIKPSKESRWLRFDDDKVVPATDREVYEESFGADSANRAPHAKPFKRFINAYMLVYMRECKMDEVLGEVSEADIPKHLVDRIETERAEAEREKKEKEEQHLYMTIKTLTNAVIRNHSGFDLWNFEEKNLQIPLPTYKIRKEETLGEFRKRIAEDMQVPLEKIRIWSMAGRQNKTIRPDAPIPETEDDKRMESIKDRYGRNTLELRLYVEESDTDGTLHDGKPVHFMPKDDPAAAQSIVIFVKYFDPFTRKMEFSHTLTVRNRGMKLQDVLPQIAERLGFPKETPLRLYEEVKPSMIDSLKVKNTFQQSELGDGDIVVAMKDLNEQEMQQIPMGSPVDPSKYFEWLQNRVVLEFKPRETEQKSDTILPEFKLELTKRLPYDEVAKRVAERLGHIDPMKIRFSVSPGPNVAPRNFIKRTSTSTLTEMVSVGGAYQAQITTLFYEILDVSIMELEQKRTMKIAFVDLKNREVLPPHDLLVPKTSSIGQVLEILRPLLKLDSEFGSGKIRMFTISQGRYHPCPDHEDCSIYPESTSILFAEEIPIEEMEMAEGDRPIGVFHYNKSPLQAHGIPFLFVLRKGERFADTKQRLKERLGVQDKDWTKIKVTWVPHNSPKPANLEDDDVLTDMDLGERDSIGLDQPDNSKQSSRFGLQKAIKFLSM